MDLGLVGEHFFRTNSAGKRPNASPKLMNNFRNNNCMNKHVHDGIVILCVM